MRHFTFVDMRCFVLFACLVLYTPLAGVAQDSTRFSSDITTEKTPWTHLAFDDDPYNFQFAIISDRSGGARPGVFEDAVMKLNWLRPEFVMSVGDLIDGASGRDSVELARQWDEHFDRIEPLRMPFFHLAGNHDIKANNTFQVDLWNKMFGTPFYSFRYKDVLFLALFTNEGFQSMTDDQVTYMERALAEHADVRWTLVFMHHPLWMYPHESNFATLESLLEDRKYTVFAGHHHRYHHESRQQANYYILATTGGGSRLLGNSFGMFDHITWVTMSDNGPVLANLRLDGILPHNVANDESAGLAAALLSSTVAESHVFVDSETKFKKGKALLTYTNEADIPLHLSGRFFHNHEVHARPSKIDAIIPPGTTQAIEIELEAVDAFNLSKGIFLEMDATLRYEHPEFPDLALNRTQAIPIRVSSYNVLPVEEADFVGSFEVIMAEPLPGTTIRYTVDGRPPTGRSPVYEQPFTVTTATTVKAALFDAAGRSSTVDVMATQDVAPGQGVMRSYYEYDTRKGIWNRVPDFSKLQPTTIKVANTLNLEQAGQRNQFFGVVYKGTIDLPESGTYRFSTISDDGSILLINGEPVVVDAVKHKARETFGEITLEAGQHTIEVQYYQHRKAMVMDVFYESPSGERVQVGIGDLSFGEGLLN